MIRHVLQFNLQEHVGINRSLHMYVYILIISAFAWTFYFIFQKNTKAGTEEGKWEHWYLLEIINIR